jgi:hypothetical protein
MVAVVLKVTDGSEKLLVPGAQQHPATVSMIRHPGGFVFNLQAERPGVGTDEAVEKGEKRPRRDDGIDPFGHILFFPF